MDQQGFRRIVESAQAGDQEDIATLLVMTDQILLETCCGDKEALDTLLDLICKPRPEASPDDVVDRGGLPFRPSIRDEAHRRVTRHLDTFRCAETDEEVCTRFLTWVQDLISDLVSEEEEAGKPPGRGDRIGPYRLREKLGAGGMGIVYLAEQEEPVRRRVALKMIQPGMDTGELILRFKTEQAALALMHHPCIVHFYDGGVTEDGRHYFAMEHVPGVSITSYADTHRLSTRERLLLFIQLCDGVQHIHEKGIIHRSLKPSDVLVTADTTGPSVKIIDFGIVKATHQRLTDETHFTEHGRVIGTPPYMSPEQAEACGLNIDTRTDIYSLGVILHELLGGTPVQGERPPPKGDLDWIVFKATEKDRTRRYSAASELAEDIRRFLGEEPVLARPPSLMYRIRCLLRRRPVAALATAPVLAAATVGLGLFGSRIPVPWGLGTALGLLSAAWIAWGIWLAHRVQRPRLG